MAGHNITRRREKGGHAPMSGPSLTSTLHSISSAPTMAKGIVMYLIRDRRGG